MALISLLRPNLDFIPKSTLIILLSVARGTIFFKSALKSGINVSTTTESLLMTFPKN